MAKKRKEMKGVAAARRMAVARERAAAEAEGREPLSAELVREREQMRIAVREQIGRVPSRERMRASARIRRNARQEIAELRADVVIEQIARGALFDPRGLFYAEDGIEYYQSDGPLRPNPKYGLDPIEPQEAPAWRKGDEKRRWTAGDLKPIHELTEAQAQNLTGIEVVMKNAVAGDGQIDRVLKYKLAPREKYVELGARYHGMLVDRVEANVNVTAIGSKLDAARARLALIEGEKVGSPATPGSATP
jgi:hypothetical protein